MIFDLLTFAQDWLADNHSDLAEIKEWFDPGDITSPAVVASETTENVANNLAEKGIQEEPARHELLESSERPLLASREIPDRPQLDSLAFTPEELVQVQQEDVARVSV